MTSNIGCLGNGILQIMAAVGETAAHHCEVVCDEAHGGPNSNWYHCKNQRKHKNFLTVEEFGMEHLRPECRTETFMKFIKNRIDRTVKVTVSYTSEKRPDTFPDSPMPYPFREHRGSNQISRCGTGYIHNVYRFGERGPCPCLECKKSNKAKMQYWEIEVFTATHVVFDQMEAKSSVVELFYDNETKEGVVTVSGVSVLNSNRYQTDKCSMICVTHDMDLMESLKRLCKFEELMTFEDDSLTHMSGVMVSHPHGVCKRISIGKTFEWNFYVKPNYSVTIRKGTRMFIPLSDEKQEDTQHTDRREINDIPGMSIPLSDEKQEDTQHTDRREINDSPGMSIPLSDEKQENTQRTDCRDSTDGPPHKMIRTSFQSSGCEISKTRATVTSQETITSMSYSELLTFLNQTTSKDMFESKVEVKVVLPRRCPFLVVGLKSSNWYTFPADTKFVLPDGTSVVIAMESKFYLSGYSLWNINNRECFLTYDMATCPGSSGALVRGYDEMFDNWIHFGCNKGKGQTGLSYYDDYFLSDTDSYSDGDDDW